MTTLSTTFPITAEGQFLAWLQGTGLLHIWSGVDRLPESRQDYYRFELLKLYLRGQRSTTRRAKGAR